MEEILGGLIMALQIGEGPVLPHILAIDGRCASGKTTLARWLQRGSGCNVVSMDDFYLPLNRRTPERMAQPGGHINRERFLEEVLDPLRRGQPAVYRPYDCHRDRFLEEVRLDPAYVTVVEGAYSCHPELWSRYDLHIFLTIDPQQQLERIRRRNGEAAVEAFREVWIPLEERYFQACRLPSRCELCFTLGEKPLEGVF